MSQDGLRSTFWGFNRSNSKMYFLEKLNIKISSHSIKNQNKRNSMWSEIWLLFNLSNKAVASDMIWKLLSECQTMNSGRNETNWFLIPKFLIGAILSCVFWLLLHRLLGLICLKIQSVSTVIIYTGKKVQFVGFLPLAIVLKWMRMDLWLRLLRWLHVVDLKRWIWLLSKLICS